MVMEKEWGGKERAILMHPPSKPSMQAIHASMPSMHPLSHPRKAGATPKGAVPPPKQDTLNRFRNRFNLRLFIFELEFFFSYI